MKKNSIFIFPLNYSTKQRKHLKLINDEAYKSSTKLVGSFVVVTNTIKKVELYTFDI